MVNKEQFSEALDLLINTFPAQGREGRLKSLYFFYGKESFETLRQAARDAAKELNAFPSPNVFERFVAAARPRKGEEIAFPCDRCKGVGIVSVDDFAYRCECQNGTKFMNFLLAPKQRTLREEIYNIKNPMQFAIGMIKMKKYKWYSEHPAYLKIRPMIIELLGPDNIKKLTTMNNSLTKSIDG